MTTAAQQNFQATYGPLAQQAGAALGVDPNIVYAQWALESGYGTNSESASYNVAGIEPNGVGATYSSPQNFEQSYVSVIQNNFPGAVNAGSDPNAFVNGLLNGTKGKYFTADPSQYVNGISQIASGNPLGNNGVAPVGTTSSQSGTAAPVSGNATGTTSTSVPLPTTWLDALVEIVTRSGIILIGLMLLFVGLIFLFINSKTVQTTTKAVSMAG